MGWPRRSINWSGLNASQTANIIGEGLHVPMVALVNYCIFLSNGPLWRAEAAEQGDKKDEPGKKKRRVARRLTSLS